MNTLTQKLHQVAAIQEMGCDTCSGLQRISDRLHRAINLHNSGLISFHEAVTMVRG
jgi:hypothetical protein